MTDPENVDLYYDPFDFAIDDDPYPVWRRLREEAPVYYNEPHDFYALSRWDDVARELPNWQTYRSGRGTVMDVIKSGLEVPPGVILFEDPPQHDLHRRLLSKVFTPRRMAAIEPLTRQFCVRALDALLGQNEFDVIADLGALVPMRTIGYLLGIPEQGQQLIRDTTNNAIDLKEGQFAVADNAFEESYLLFSEYIDWRADHPSDDLMTQLLNAEVEDDGEVRKLTRTEVLTYTSMIAGAGNETTTRLIAFACQLLADHPDQRSELVADPELIPGAIEEVLRFEAPSPVQARYVAHDTECLGNRSRRARSCCCSTARPTATRRVSLTGSGSTFTAAAATSASARVCTSASVPRWHACKRGSCWKSFSSGGRSGTSTTRERRRHTPPACEGGPVADHDTMKVARRARGSLTEDAIVETAFAIAADSSIEELSIPLIARSLDVGVTSIYWHVRNKSELLDAMTDRALRRSGLPAFAESDDWRASLMAHARGVRQTFLGDPVLTDLILIRGALSPMARRLGDQETQKAIANMIDSGLDEQTAHDTYSAVSELVRGSVLLARLAQKHSAAQETESADGADSPAPRYRWTIERSNFF